LCIKIKSCHFQQQDRIGDDYVKWNDLDAESQRPQDLIHLWNLKKLNSLNLGEEWWLPEAGESRVGRKVATGTINYRFTGVRSSCVLSFIRGLDNNNELSISKTRRNDIKSFYHK
jgi:hypothetical protein